MRTTLRIEDDLMAELQELAGEEKLSLTRLVNRLLRIGLQTARRRDPPPRFQQKTFRMGEPALAIDKALALAGQLEDDEILRKMDLRK